jgi:Na+/melibiose symporter-like transporter
MIDFLKIVKTRIAPLYLNTFIALTMLAITVDAAVSERTDKVAEETQLVGAAITYIVGWGGFIIFMIALISGAIEKKNDRPLKWQVWGIVIGVIMFSSALYFNDVGESIAGDDSGAAFSTETKFGGSGG